MREIKFRAWDGEQMLYPEFPTTIQIDGNYVGFTNGRIDYGTYVDAEHLIQYTGLKDKNGKEIYEGDVVQEDIRRDKRSKPIMRWSVVVYSEKGMFIVECLPKSLRQWNELYKENDEVEVIGNIYENPELLNPLTR